MADAALAGELGMTVWHETTVARFTDSRPGSPGTCDYGNALLARGDLAQRVRVNLLDPGTCKSDATVATTLPECRVLMGADIRRSDAPPRRTWASTPGSPAS